MTVNRNEPATKFFGPNYPFVRAEGTNHWIIRLHNLQPGTNFNPAEAPELDGELIFIPLNNPAIWLWPGIFFFGTMRFHPFSMLLLVTNRFDRSRAFAFQINFIQTQWAINDLTEPTDNFTFNGTATLIFRKQ